MMRPFQGVRKTENLVLPAAALAVASALAAGVYLNAGRNLPEQAVAGRPIQIPGDGYVSSQACRACHPSQYASWHGSFHRTMTQVATPATVAPSFDRIVVEAIAAEPMVLEQRGQELWAEFVDPDAPLNGIGRPSDAHLMGTGRITRQVVMTTGSHNQQIFWYATGNSRVLGQLPAIWLTNDRRWVPRGAAIMRPPGAGHVSETGAWNGICVSCHTTGGLPKLDAPLGSRPIAALTADTRAVEFGIACESCHGPAEAHARANRNPLRRYTLHLTARPDATIVQPARLRARLSSQVCGQCHALWEFADAQSERQSNARGLPYRPGDELSATRFIVQPTANLESPTMTALLDADPRFVRDIFWSDGMVRATGREYNGLIESPCYKHASDDTRTLTCSSCHTMHKSRDDARAIADWADDQIAPHASGNDACVSCHTAARGFQAGAHSHHRADSAGSSCYNCHMPYTTYGLLKTIRSHQISSPSVQATLDTGRPNACNLCHLDKTLAWSAETLHTWYGAPVPALGDDDITVAASVVALLKGDAGQRAIVAQSMGWTPAQEASGSGWMAPYLALTQKDPYDAVRYIAARSMRTLPPFRRGQLPRGNAQLLIAADGTFDAARVNRLVRERNNRRIVYRE